MTREERLAYYKRYNKDYKKHSSSYIEPERLTYTVLNPIKPELERNFFKGDSEKLCCSRFGCGKELTITERLFGNVCINCQKINT